MAQCLWKIHAGVSKPASKIILTNCNLSRSILRDVPEVLDSCRWSANSAFLSRHVSGFNDKVTHSHSQSTSTKTTEAWLTGNSRQHKCQGDGISRGSGSLHKLSVNLTELYARDPLAILLHSHLPIHNHSFKNGRETEINKIRAHKRALEDKLSMLHSIKSTPHPYHHTDLAHQLSAACSVAEAPVVAPFPAYRALASASSPSSLCRDPALALSSLYCGPPLPQPSTEYRGQAPGGGGNNPNPHGLPSAEQLKRVHDDLIEALSNFFVRSANYNIYDPNIIFENRIRGTVTKGLNMYAMQMSLLNTIGHMKHAHVRFDIIKITQHPEEGTIKVRWRIKGVKSRQAFAGFLKAKKWSVATMIQETDSPNWYDGFSTFHVNSAGLISRHVADNMMPDDERNVHKPSLLARLAISFGVLPKAGHGSAIVTGQLGGIY